MNKHIFIDKLSASAGAWIAGSNKFFAKGIDSPEFEKQVEGVKLSIPVVKEEAIVEVPADTLVGALDPAFRVALWKGSDYPTIIYHHGNNERPFSFNKTAKNTFYNIFIRSVAQVEANLIVVRAPFHNCTLKYYQEKMTELSNFTAMIATSVKLNEEIIQQIKKTSSQPIITSGISLGGWVTNLHRGIFNSSTAYIPIMAGTFLAELFLKSTYRKLAAPLALSNPDKIRRVLNFHHIFENAKTPNVFPLLARHDQFIEFDVQNESYKAYPMKSMSRGHVTGALNIKELRKHIGSAMDVICA